MKQVYWMRRVVVGNEERITWHPSGLRFDSRDGFGDILSAQLAFPELRHSIQWKVGK